MAKNKKRNPGDLTGRNLRPLKRKDANLTKLVAELRQEIDGLRVDLQSVVLKVGNLAPLSEMLNGVRMNSRFFKSEQDPGPSQLPGIF